MSTSTLASSALRGLTRGNNSVMEVRMALLFADLAAGVTFLIVIGLGVGGSFTPSIYHVIRGGMIERAEKKRRTRVWCVCRDTGTRRVGFVLKGVLEKASQEHWYAYQCGKKRYDFGHISAPEGIRLEPTDVVVVKDKSPEFYTLFYGIFLEQATFQLPTGITPMEEAVQKMHGCKWNGEFRRHF